MWKKYWTQSGDSWVEDDDSTSTSSSSNYTVTATQAMQQYQQIQQQYQWMQTQGIGQTYGNPVGITSTSNPWIMSPKPVYPYAIDEEFILIEWARKRGDRYAEELAQRIAMWDSIKMMKQIQDTGGPYLDSYDSYSTNQLKQWTYKYYYGGTTSTGANTAAPATSSTITVGGIPIQWDKYNPDVT